MRLVVFLLVTALPVASGFSSGDVREDRESKVRTDKTKVESEGYWIYGDLQKGIVDARRTGRPIVVTLRCLPCEECVKLDEDVLHADERLRKLLDQFVRVRIISTNGLDLSLFQFDTDQSFTMFFLNSDGTIYGRFGTRSHRTEWQEDVSFRGLALALEGALNLHGDYPNNKQVLAGKKGPEPKYPSPDKLPGLRDKYGSTLNYAGNVVESCIHCHQIGDAERMEFIQRGERIPDQLLFSYPHPKAIGLILDPDERASVLRVDQDSPAGDAGFQPGDRILNLSGQPLLSIADVQWVLHHTAAEGAQVPATVQRGDTVVPLTLELTAGWRDRDDIAWRVSTWEMRRFTIGGMVLNSLPPEERAKLGLPNGSMALVIEHIGQYNPHDAAKRSGFRQGDIVIAYDGKTDLLRETDVLAHALRHFQAGRDVEMELIRNGKRETRTLNLP